MGVLGECHDYGVSVEREAEIEDAVRVLLQGLGEDINREGLRKTPLRVAAALRDGTRGYHQNVKDIVSGALFPEAGLESSVGSAGGAGGLVIVRDLDLFSYCESCLLPFQLKCHVGYVPSGHRVVGLSKLSRVAEVFAKRLQHPQRLADEICTALQHSITPTGVAVVLHSSHIHFPNRQGCVRLSVMSGSGAFADDKAGIWTDFLGLLRFRGLTADDARSRSPLDKFWCPSRAICKMAAPDPSLLAAVSSILYSLGEDPSREDLVGTPARFVNWLMNFKNSNMDMKLNGLVRGGKRESALTLPQDFSHVCSELNMPFWSQCEHHLLPFHGVVHVGYYGSSRVMSTVGKSLLQSVVQFYGFKLQVQERLTRQIAEVASSILGEDVIVVVEASHTCMISRGIEKLGSSTATIAVLGRFSTDPTARAKFLQIIPTSASSWCS